MGVVFIINYKKNLSILFDCEDKLNEESQFLYVKRLVGEINRKNKKGNIKRLIIMRKKNTDAPLKLTLSYYNPESRLYYGGLSFEEYEVEHILKLVDNLETSTFSKKHPQNYIEYFTPMISYAYSEGRVFDEYDLVGNVVEWDTKEENITRQVNVCKDLDLGIYGLNFGYYNSEKQEYITSAFLNRQETNDFLLLFKMLADKVRMEETSEDAI